MHKPASPPPSLKQKLLEKCKKICLEASNNSIDLSCLYDCIVDGVITPMKVKATLDKVFLAFLIGISVVPSVKDVIVARKECGEYIISYTCSSSRGFCDYLAVSAAEALERLPGVAAVVASFNHPVYELHLIPPSALRL